MILTRHLAEFFHLFSVKSGGIIEDCWIIQASMHQRLLEWSFWVKCYLMLAQEMLLPCKANPISLEMGTHLSLWFLGHGNHYCSCLDQSMFSSCGSWSDLLQGMRCRSGKKTTSHSSLHAQLWNQVINATCMPLITNQRNVAFSCTEHSTSAHQIDWFLDMKIKIQISIIKIKTKKIDVRFLQYHLIRNWLL